MSSRKLSAPASLGDGEPLVLRACAQRMSRMRSGARSIPDRESDTT
ncbi:hypothetical protein [Billgrantia gudaonensis]|nr:hypothetical protein [Halomonas gudaonensis]